MRLSTKRALADFVSLLLLLLVVCGCLTLLPGKEKVLWWFASEEKERIIIRVAEMPGEAEIELWLDGKTVFLRRPDLVYQVIKQGEQ